MDSSAPISGKSDKVQNKYVYGIGKVGDSVKLLLDPEKLLNDEDMSVLEQANNLEAEEREV